MPNMETLIDSISQIITDYKTEPPDKIYFSTIDLKYTYSQLNLYPDTAKHCNFNNVSGDMTGKYRFKPVFSGLTDMPAEFQKAIDYTLISLKNIFCFLDDIFFASKGSEEDHFHCWCILSLLGYIINKSGTSPLESKTSAIFSLQPPNTLKKLRSFLGLVHYINKLIPNLAQLCYPLRPLLRKSTK